MSVRRGIIRVYPRSSAAKILDHLHEVIKQIVGIMRPRCSLRMVLHAKHRLAAMPETLQRLVVQIDMRQLHFGLVERIRIHSESMIVRSYLNFLRHLIQHRMIRAAMPELQLVGFASQREP